MGTLNLEVEIRSGEGYPLERIREILEQNAGSSLDMKVSQSLHVRAEYTEPADVQEVVDSLLQAISEIGEPESGSITTHACMHDEDPNEPCIYPETLAEWGEPHG